MRLPLPLTTAIGLCAIAMPGSARTIQVGPGEPIETIQGGVDAAVDGDTVLVLPGEYREHVANALNIVLLSRDGPEVTHWSGLDDEEYLLDIGEGGHYGWVIVEGFDFDGRHEMKYGVYTAVIARATVKGNSFHDFGNDGTDGIALLAIADTALVIDNAIWNNWSGPPRGGGAYISSGRHMHVQNNRIEYNNVSQRGGGAAGMYVSRGGTALIRNNSFIGNGEETKIYDRVGAGALGGASQNCTDCQIIGNLFIDNHAHLAGALGVGTEEPELIMHNLFIDNFAHVAEIDELG